MFIDKILEYLLPPIITKFFDFVVHGNTYLAGTWVDIGYEWKTRKELYYALFYITKKNGEIEIDGRVYDTNFSYLWSFKSDFCRQKHYTLKFVNVDGENENSTMKIVRGEFSFTKNGLKSPASFNGYYISDNGRRTIEGVKLTKNKTRELKAKYPENSLDPKNILKLLIPYIKDN